MVACVVAACGGTDRVDRATAETVCEQWCAGDGVCGFGWTTDQCFDLCVDSVLGTCGEHLLARYQCDVDHACHDPAQTCSVPFADFLTCTGAIQRRCEEQCPWSESRPQQPRLCFEAHGDCELTKTCYDRCPDSVFECVESGGECGVHERCSQKCPDFQTECVWADGDCEVARGCREQCGPHDDVAQCARNGGWCVQF